MSPKPNGQNKQNPNGKPRGLRRDRDCLTCKSHGIKCDLNRPSCGQCLQKSVSCKGYISRVKWTAISSLSSPPSKRGANRAIAADNLQSTAYGVPAKLHGSLPHVPSVNDSNWTTHYFHYVEHFRSNIAASIRSHDTLSSVWKFGELSFSRKDNANINNTLTHTAAIKAVREAVAQGGILSIFSIVTFAFMDVYKGPFGAWSQHLKGARALLDLHGGTMEQISELCSNVDGLQEVLSLLCWYDVTGLLIRRDRPLVFEDWHRLLMIDSIFELVGCPRETFFLLADIAKVGFSCSSPDSTIYVAAADQLMRMTLASESCLNRTENAWRCASVITIMENESLHDCKLAKPIISKATATICDVLCTFPKVSARYRHLSYAAFMAGRHADCPRHVLEVKKYWQSFHLSPDPIYPDGERISFTVHDRSYIN